MERGRWRRKHLPNPSVQQRGYVPVKSHHKPGHRHARPNRPDPKVSHLLWSCCQKTPPPPPHPPLLPLSSVLLVSQPITRGQKYKVCTKRSTCCQIFQFVHVQVIWDSSREGLRLPEISLEIKSHDRRLSSAHSRRLCWWRKKENWSFSDGKKSNTLQGAIFLVLDLLWSAF